MTVRLAKSIVGEREAAAVARVIIGDGYLGMGREVQAFEEEIARYLGVDAAQVVCVNSGTAAVHLAVQAAVDRGAEILVQSLTFVATFQAIIAGGAQPVPCEILPTTLGIDLADAEKRLTERTRAIMPVHYASSTAGLDAVYEFAAKYKLRVIEDAAHAFGCRHNGMLVGSFGDLRCFSFDGIKNVTSGEGGAIVTADDNVLKVVKDARLLGVERDTEARYSGGRSWDFDVSRPGYRYHMSNIFAAIGRVQLQRLESEFAPRRVALAKLYEELLADIPGVSLLQRELGSVVPHLQPIRVSGQRRDALRAHMSALGIETGLHYKPNHLLTLFGAGKTKLPVTEAVWDELLSLPLHPGLTNLDIKTICDSIRQFLTTNA